MKDELLIKYLLRETSPEENREIEAWLVSDDRHWQQLHQVKWIWEQSKDLAIKRPIDPEEAWKKFKSRRANREQNKRSGYKGPAKTNFHWYRAAAVILLFIGALWSIYAIWIAPQHPYFSTIEITSGAEPEEKILPDGTTITLNKASSVAYTESLLSKKRLVSMTGEVFFDVKRDKQRPFEIVTGDVNIKVLGTSFNVKTNKKGTEVIVETGLVQVKRSDIIIRLKPNEKAIAAVNKSGLAQVFQSDHLFDYYRTKRFKLNETPLWRFVEILNEAYGAHIFIENSTIASLPITTTFEKDSLANILNTLTETLQIRALREGNRIILKK